MRILTRLFFLVLLTFTLQSCFDNKGTEDQGAISLTVWTPHEDQSDISGNWLAKQLEAFKAIHPDWNIVFKVGICSEENAKSIISINPDFSADVYMFPNDQIPELIKIKALLKLEGETANRIRDINTDVIVNTVTYNDSIYGVPFTTNTWFMFYDKRVFSPDDVKSLESMLEKGKVGFPLSNSWYIASFYVANGCTLFGKDGTDKNAGIDFSGKKASDVTRYLVELVKDKNFVTMSELKPTAFIDGSINALFSGSWDYKNALHAIGGENLGICAAPTYNLNGKILQLKSFAGSKAIGVNARTKYPKEATALALFLGDVQAQKSHYELRNIIPTAKSIDVSGDTLAQAQMDAIFYASIVQPIQKAMENYWDPATKMGEELLNGKVTLENATEKTEKMNTEMNKK